MILRPRSVAARAPLREEQPSPGLRLATVRHQLDPHLDPWIGLEHFHMTDERRGARPIAGHAAVTYLFEDSRGAMIARDDGGEARIGPGGLHWLEPGAGAMHECGLEQQGHDVHGLRMLVDLREREGAPRAFHVGAAEMPELAARGARVRIVAGSAMGARSPLDGVCTPVTILDVHLDPGAELAHVAPAGHHAWALAIVGDGFAGGATRETVLKSASAVAFAADGDTIRLRAGSIGLHAIVAHAAPLRRASTVAGAAAGARGADTERRFRV